MATNKALTVIVARKPDAELDSIFANAKVMGNASQTLLALFRKAKTDKRKDDMVREFILGRYCGALNVERNAAEAALALKPFDKKKAGSDRRSDAQQKALQAARALASSITRTAGWVSKKTGAARKPRATVAKPEAQGMHGGFHVKRFVSPGELHTFMNALADVGARALAMNATLKLDDAGTVYRDSFAVIKKAAQPVK